MLYGMVVLLSCVCVCWCIMCPNLCVSIVIYCVMLYGLWFEFLCLWTDVYVCFWLMCVCCVCDVLWDVV